MWQCSTSSWCLDGIYQKGVAQVCQHVVSAALNEMGLAGWLAGLPVCSP